MSKFEVGDRVMCVDISKWVREDGIKIGDVLEVGISGKSIVLKGKQFFVPASCFELLGGVRYEDEEI
jgi:hypothetical protein